MHYEEQRAMSDFTDGLAAAARGGAGLTTGAPAAMRRTGWGEIYAVAGAGAGALAARGVAAGDAVAVLAASPAEVAPAAQAVWRAGGSVTMLHQPTARTEPSGYARETLGVLKVIGARLVVVGAPFEALADQLRGAGVAVVTVAQLRAGSPGVGQVERAAADPALLQLTSGSTASPKAVRITHGNLWANVEAMCTAADLRAGRDVMVSWLPLFHDMGMVGFLTMPMCRGLDSVLITPTDFLRDPLRWAQLISTYRGTATAAPNFAYALTARVLARAEAGSLDLSSMRFLLNGAEPIEMSAVEAFLAAGARFGLSDTAMVCAYGLAEATLGVSFHQWGTPVQVDTVDPAALERDLRAVPVPAGSDTGRRLPVLGPPFPGISVRVVTGSGEPRGDREVGVLQVKGESVTELYLTEHGPQPTRGADGWLDTGDLGYLVDGRVVVCGRVKDVIIMGGRNIHPTDIERVATTVPGVRAGNAVAVRWQADGRRESYAVAVESKESGDADAVERIATGVRSAVTAAIGARPALVRVLPPGSLPKTPSGKLRRSAALALLTSNASVEVAASTDGTKR